jgi:hypothetical protein
VIELVQQADYGCWINVDRPLAIESALWLLQPAQGFRLVAIEEGVVSRKPRNFRQPINMACLALGR